MAPWLSDIDARDLQPNRDALAVTLGHFLRQQSPSLLDESRAYETKRSSRGHRATAHMKGIEQPKHSPIKTGAVFQHRVDFRPSFPTRHSWASFVSKEPFPKYSADALSTVASRATVLLRLIPIGAIGADAAPRGARIRRPCSRKRHVSVAARRALLHSIPAAPANE